MTDQTLHCYKHPDRETLLRCNQCGRPICSDCAVKVSTGYRCKECVHEQQKRFDTSIKRDYIIGPLIAFAVALAGSLICTWIPWIPGIITSLLLGGLCGRLICALTRKALNKRRSSNLTLAITAAAGIGALIPRLQSIIVNVNLMSFGAVWMTNSLYQIFIDLLFVIVICGTVWMELSGMIFKG